MAHYVTNKQGDELVQKGLCTEWMGKNCITEHWQVIDWLLEKHGIWIKIQPQNNEEDIVDWEFAIFKISDNEVIFNSTKSGFRTPHEAYSAAFDYILDKLI